MKTRLLLALPLFGLTVLANAEDMKAKLQPIYDQIAKATKDKDTTALRKIMRRYGTNDFVYIHHDGKRQNTKQMLAEMESMAKVVGPFSRSTMAIESSAGNSKNAVVTVVSDWAMTMKGSDGKVHKVEGSERTTDTWIAVGKGWKLKQIQTKTSKASMDGKPIPPN
jgi:hypothetical protein